MIPKGATHIADMGYGTKFYMRHRITHYNSLNEEFLQPMYVWESYDVSTKSWVKESGLRFTDKYERIEGAIEWE